MDYGGRAIEIDFYVTSFSDQLYIDCIKQFNRVHQYMQMQFFYAQIGNVQPEHATLFFPISKMKVTILKRLKIQVVQENEWI